MANSEDVGGERRCAVAIVAEEIPQAGWHRLDLGRILDGLSARSDEASGRDGSTGRTVGGASAGFGGLLAGRLGQRVPPSAFVAIGAPLRRTTGPKLVPVRPVGRRIANDNLSTGESRSVWRDLFFLAMLAATVAGAFWSGRVQGYQRVIVVPGPSSFYSVVT